MKEPTHMTFWGAGTPRSFRPLWVAEELGLAYEHAPIGPRTGETQTAEYTWLNPKQKIPYLVDGDVHLSESVAISRYLIERYGTSATMTVPSTIESRAREDEWVCYVYGEIDETALYVIRRHGDLQAIYGEAPAAIASSQTYASKHLRVIADHLDAREFLLDERFGLADVLLVSCLDWAMHCGIELLEPLVRYRQAITQRPAYAAAFRRNYTAQNRVAQNHTAQNHASQLTENS